MSKFKSGIEKSGLPLGNLLATIKRWTPKSLCYLCQQPSTTALCPICEQDCSLFDRRIVGANLLHWPSIRRDLLRAPYTSLQALSYYHWPLDHLIKQFKYGHPELAAPIARLMVKYLPLEALPRPECLLPVPISLSRYTTRRYHQTALLAQALGQQLQIPVARHWARRKPWQRAQQTLGRRARLNSLKDAWTVTADTMPAQVAIIDDVVTTGATVTALSRRLHQCFPHTQIAVWCLAITPQHTDARILTAARNLDVQHGAINE